MKLLLIRWALALAALPGGSLLAETSGIAPPPDARIVVLGEVHDNPAHHDEQARLVALVAPRAVVWEMLTPAQIVAAEGTDPRSADYGPALGWEAAGWPDFAMYHPIFVAAGSAVHLGAAQERAALKRAMAEGAAAVLADPAIPLPPLAADDLAARVSEQDAAHCHALPADLLPGMVEVQRLRDAAMAQAALRALHDYGAPVVVITGSGHARTDRGVPALIRAADPAVRVWSLGQTETPDAPGDNPAPYDAVNVTAPAPREDPCAAFAPAGPGSKTGN